MDHQLQSHQIACLLDAMQLAPFSGLRKDPDRFSLWSCGAGEHQGYQTPTVQHLIALGYLEHPIVTSIMRPEYGTRDTKLAKITMAGIEALKSAAGDHPLLNSEAQNRAKWRVIEGGRSAG